MSKIRIYARNLGANWIGYGANLAVAFFMSPFIIHSLGNERYGVWTLLTSLTGYLGLVDIGVRGGTGRYINYYLGRDEPEEVSNVVCTSLLFYAIVSVAIFMVSAILAFFFGDIFKKVEPQYVEEARWVLLLLALNVWVGFFSSTFTQLLTAAERFDLQMVSDVTVLAIRTTGTIWVLIKGRGLVELAVVQVVSGLLGCFLIATFARWKGTPAKIHLRHCHWANLLEVFNYGFWSFLGNGAAQLGLYASSAIIGILIGVKEITYFSIGAMLTSYAANFVNQITTIMIPDILKAGGRNDHAHLQALMGKGSRAIMFLAVPVLVGFMTLGAEFINVWMGPGYSTSAWILLILSTAQFGWIANGPVTMALVGLGHIRLWATFIACQSLTALILSIVLTMFTNLGIYGIAIGMALPIIVTHNIWLFIVAYHKVGASPLEAVKSTTLRWVVGAILFSIPCLLASSLIPHGGWTLFWLKVAIVSVLYVPIGLFVVLQPSESISLLTRIKSKWHWNANVPDMET